MALSDAVAYAIAAWTLDETSGTRVDQVGSYDLNDINSVGSAAGVFGNAASFNAAASQRLYASITPPSGNTFSVCLWIKSTNTGRAVFGWNNNTSAGSGVHDRELTIATLLEWYVYDGAPHTIVSDGSVTDGNWHSVVVVLDAGVMRMFIDGVEQADSESATNGYNGYTTPYFLVGLTEQVATHYNGEIDDIVILDGYALNETEAAELYNGGAGVAFEDWAGAPPAATEGIFVSI